MVIASLNSDGYDVECYKLCSKDWGLPQSRNRVYIVGVKPKVLASKPAQFFETFGKCMRATKTPAPDLDPGSCFLIALNLFNFFGGQKLKKPLEIYGVSL